MTNLRHLLPLVLAAALLAGCRPPLAIPATQGSVQETQAGHLQIAIRWPRTRALRAQAIPAIATHAYLYVSSESGAPLATMTLSRKGETPVSSASIALPPGTGYGLSAVLTDDDAVRVALGESAPFAIKRNQATDVQVTLAHVIDTTAGTGANGSYDATPSLAIEAVIKTPTGLALDHEGNLYVSINGHHTVRRIGTDGRLTTVAGTGAKGAVTAAGQEASGIASPLDGPQGLAVGAGGDLYISDFNHKCLRLLPASAGTRHGKTIEAGKLYTLYTSTQSMYAIAAAPDGGLYFTEGDHLSRLPFDSTVPETVAGTAQSGKGADGPALTSALSIPDGVILDPVGNVLFSDRSNHRVRMLCKRAGTYFGLPMEEGSVYTIAGTGAPTTASSDSLGDAGSGLAATFKFPRGLALDARGNLYIADASNNRVRKLSRLGTVSTVVGSGKGSAIDPETGLVGLGDDGSALDASLWSPAGVAVGPNGALYISDSNHHRVCRIWL